MTKYFDLKLVENDMDKRAKYQDNKPFGNIASKFGFHQIKI